MARRFTKINETLHQAGKDDEFGSVRVEEGRVRNPDGTVDWNKIAWKVYRYDDLSPEQRQARTAQLPVAGIPVGELTEQGIWNLVGEAATEEEALEIARNL